MIALADLKAWLKVTGTADDTLLTNLEARAVDFLERETERVFDASATRTEFFVPGTGTDRLRLNENPSAVTTVEERLYPGDSWTAIPEGDDDGWELQAPKSRTAGALVRRKNGHKWSQSCEYRVTYEFGYVAGSEPGEIRQLVLDLVALQYRARGREGFKSESIGSGDYMYTLLERAPEHVSASLERRLSRWRSPLRTMS